MTGIYKITEKSTGRCYIGQSINIERRWKTHQGKRGKFPLSDFDYEILVTCPIEDLNEIEILMIATFDSHHNGFNKTIGGTDVKCIYQTEETRRKRSNAMIGKNVGKKLSDEHRQKLSDSHKGKPAHNKGKSASNEARQNMSEAHRGKTFSEERKKKMSDAAKRRWNK